jgi:hypothetical protein
MEKSIAVLTIKEAGRMTAEGREELAEWLRAQADAVVAEGEQYADRFRARLLVYKRN